MRGDLVAWPVIGYRVVLYLLLGVLSESVEVGVRGLWEA